MARALLKCVPDDDPNADGVWLNRKVPRWLLGYGIPTRILFTELSTYAPEGMHVVRYEPTQRTRRQGLYSGEQGWYKAYRFRSQAGAL